MFSYSGCCKNYFNVVSRDGVKCGRGEVGNGGGGRGGDGVDDGNDGGIVVEVMVVIVVVTVIVSNLSSVYLETKIKIKNATAQRKEKKNPDV